MDLSILKAVVRQDHRAGKAKVDFPNGYTASVISDGYGEEDGLYEIAVMHNGSLDYSTPVTNDVLGDLTEDEVIKHCNEIAALPSKD